VLRDPFGLAQRVVRGEHEDEILVLPRTFPVNVTASGGEAMPAHARAALIAAAETEIDGVRQFREGTPASRIHWPSLARGHGLMERKLISEADSRPLVVLDPRAPASQDALDNAVRAAGPDGTVEVAVRREGSRAVLEVSDDGPGFGRVPTQQGLGLVTVRRFVSRVRGTLDIGRSRLGGARLTLSMPTLVGGLVTQRHSA